MKFDQYELKARVIPAVFSMILPVLIFNHFVVSDKLADFLDYIEGVKILSNITISGVLLYFISQFGRVIGKELFEKSFYVDEIRMPTTDMLMFSNHVYSEQHKMKIRKKISCDFGVELPTYEEESLNEVAARTRIVETMALIRKKLEGNKFLLQHNIEYGAMRNAIGGSVIGFGFSIINIIVFLYVVPLDLALLLSFVTATVYFMMIILSKILMNFYGRSYAKILFREFLSD